MIPILFSATATTFTTQGLGRLSGALDCIVTEERNGQYELEMEYPVDGRHWSDLAHSRIIYAKPADGKDPQPFRIYRITKPIDGRSVIYARHISYQLSHIPVMPFTARSFTAALSGLVTNAAETCPFTVWTDKTATGDFEVSVPASFRALLGGTENSLLDTFGTVEYEFDNYVVKAHANRGVDRGVVLRYGKNITDLKQEENIENTITGICPYWVDRGTGYCKTLPEKVLWSNRASNFPYKRTVPVDFSDDFEEEPTDTELREAGNNYITANNIGIPDVSIDLSFIPLWQSEEYAGTANQERLNLCDTVTVEFEKLDISTEAKVVKTVYDVLRERYRSIEVGNTRSTLAKTIVDQSRITNQKIDSSKSMLEAYINYISEKITGGKGGYIVFNYNADGLPEEMLIMDTQSESTATNIIRLNQNGIAFSTNGGATYTTGWTIDGVFSASFIGTGTLDANVIRAGVLQDVLGTNYWDMETGEFRLASTTKVGASGTTDTISSLLSGLETQIDAKIETWAQSTNPASSWTTNATRQKHDGDLWLYTGTSSITVGSVTIKPQGVYQYNYNSGSPVWSAYSSTSDNLFDLADGKSTIYYGTYRTGSASSYTPSSTAKALAVGDFRYYSGYTYICTDASTPTWTRFTDAEAGDYLVDSYTGCTYKWTGSAWSKQTDYATAIDDAIDDYDDTLTQTMIFNRLTNNGETQGIYLSSGKLYINATYIGTGTMTSIAIRNGTPTNGVYPFSVDASGNLVARSATIKNSSGSLYGEIADAQFSGGYGSKTGYIDFNNYWNGGGTYQGVYGTRVAGKGCLCLMTPHLLTGAYQDGGSFAGDEGGSGHLTFCTNLRSYSDGSMTWTDWTLYFKNGLMISDIS